MNPMIKKPMAKMFCKFLDIKKVFTCGECDFLEFLVIGFGRPADEARGIVLDSVYV